jgi:hypothetical protein
MKNLLPLMLTTLAAGCQPASPMETVEFLVANPERLKELRDKCRLERHQVNDELCARVAEATNKRFMAPGKSR